MKAITLKIIESEDGQNIETTLRNLAVLFASGHFSGPMYFTGDIEKLETEINDTYRNDIELRNSVSGGCYGARTGKSYKGLTLYCCASLFPDRFLDSDNDEIVNLFYLIDENGGELLSSQNGDDFEEMAENLGTNVSRNNTYNYAGHDSETPFFLFDADYAIIGDYENDAVYLSIKFHCGGDVRGNYTEKSIYKFESLDDVYSVVYPMAYLKEDSESDAS